MAAAALGREARAAYNGASVNHRRGHFSLAMAAALFGAISCGAVEGKPGAELRAAPQEFLQETAQNFDARDGGSAGAVS